MPVASSLNPRSAIRYRPLRSSRTKGETPSVLRASRSHETVPAFERVVEPPASAKFSTHSSLLWLGSGMLLTVVVVVIGQFLLGWMSTTWDNWQYGYPRTFQTDAFVGHEQGNTPSHFIALNQHGRIEVIELPGDDATHARIYIGPQLYGSGADLVPVTLQFSASSRGHHPDMIVLFQHSQLVFHNTGASFQTPVP